MIAEIARAVSCLAAGEVLSRFLPIALPAPIIGLMLLFGWLLWHGTVPPALGALADQMLGLFGLFFVPAGVGVVAYGQTLQTDYLAITLAITAGTLVTIVVSAAAAAALAAIASHRARSAAYRARLAARRAPSFPQHGAAPWQDTETAPSSPS